MIGRRRGEARVALKRGSKVAYDRIKPRMAITEDSADIRVRAAQGSPSGESTVQLLGRARGGDDGALEALFRRYLPALQRWARGRLPRGARDVMETDDLVQATVLRTLRRIDDFDPDHSGAFQAYMRRGILNALRDEMRRKKRMPTKADTARGVEAPSPSPIEDAIGRETLARYDAALERLKPIEREAVVARVELCFSYRQIAEALGKPSADAARMTVSRALLRMAREMAT